MIPPALADRALTPAPDSVCLGWKEKLEYTSPLSSLGPQSIDVKLSFLSLPLREYSIMRDERAPTVSNPISEQVHAHSCQDLQQVL